jgi:cytochrome c peroxidase
MHGSLSEGGASGRPQQIALVAVTALALAALVSAVLLLTSGVAFSAADEQEFAGVRFPDTAGAVMTVKGPNCTLDGVDVCTTDNPFFDEGFGTNGQDCASCHQANLGWSVTPAFLRTQFQTTKGLAAQFRLNDSASRPDADISTLPARKEAFDLFTRQGLARIAIKLSNANDFAVVPQNTKEFGPLPNPNDIQNPCTAADPQPCLGTLSLFRRPLVQSNSFFDSAVLWDGRQNVCVEPTPPPGDCTDAPLRAPLLVAQVKGAARTLLLNPNPTDVQATQVAHFMTGTFVAQVADKRAGELTALGALGGPQFLADLAKGPVGSRKPPCTPLVEASKAAGGAGNATNCTAQAGFNIFSSWSTLGRANTDPCLERGNQDGRIEAARLLIACGENIFNNHPVNEPDLELPGGVIELGRDAQNLPKARCTTCHASSNVGSNPDPNFIIPLTPRGGLSQEPSLFMGGETDAAGDPFFVSHPSDRFCALQQFKLPHFRNRTSKLPLYTLIELIAPGGTPTGNSIKVTDPGQALISHSFENAGAMKPPILRDLAARAPYFHNGAAETLDDLVDFYNQNFSMGLTAHEHKALVAFLNAL